MLEGCIEVFVEGKGITVTEIEEMDVEGKGSLWVTDVRACRSVEVSRILVRKHRRIDMRGNCRNCGTTLKSKWDEAGEKEQKLAPISSGTGCGPVGPPVDS